ncbi:MAG: hypothetical protein HYX53_05740 [Chloroflexi bacterium]|nr:hypothetical protein [Chloroflexota bacterium]
MHFAVEADEAFVERVANDRGDCVLVEPVSPNRLARAIARHNHTPLRSVPSAVRFTRDRARRMRFEETIEDEPDDGRLLVVGPKLLRVR